jgi:hypothetical protein
MLSILSLFILKLKTLKIEKLAVDISEICFSDDTIKIQYSVCMKVIVRDLYTSKQKTSSIKESNFTSRSVTGLPGFLFGLKFNVDACDESTEFLRSKYVYSSGVARKIC